MNKCKCQITVSDNGNNQVNGHENFWECERPAVAAINDPLRGRLTICKMHLNVYNRARKKYGNRDEAELL